MRKLLVGLVVCSLASTASAALTMDIVKNASPGAGLDSYTIWFKGTVAGDELAAFNGSITGSLNQVWGNFGGYSATVYDPSTSDTWPGFAALHRDRDTRLLLASGDLTTVVAAPDEDASGLLVLPPSSVHEEGQGTYLANTAHTNMVFGLLAGSRSLNLAFAQVVIPTGREFRIVGDAAAADEVQKLSFDETIPEPATVGLLVAGSIVALIRRRR